MPRPPMQASGPASTTTSTSQQSLRTLGKKRRRCQSGSPIDLFPSPPATAPSPSRSPKRLKTFQEHIDAQNGDNGDNSASVIRPPRFWDNLTRVPLVRSALAELDRRNQQFPAPTATSTRPAHTDLKQYARRGGPDISDIRGQRKMPSNRGQRDTRQRAGIRKPRGNRQGRGSSRSASGTSSKQTRTTGPYDAAFKQSLIDWNIWPIGHYLPSGEPPAPPTNILELKARLEGSRMSLEPETYTEEDFQQFLKAYSLSNSEEGRSRTLDRIEGDTQALSSLHIKRGPVKLTNLSPLVPVNFTPGNPDRTFGARPESLNLGVRKDLAQLILPTTFQDILCPNFIVHIKGPLGNSETANIQAAYDGALAARGMEALCLYGREDGEADGECEQGQAQPCGATARTISCTFVDGVLRMYAVHRQPRSCDPSQSTRLDMVQEVQKSPESPSEAAEYIMTPVGGWIMNMTRDGFRDGALAFRNGLDWAREQRDEAIRRANKRADMATDTQSSSDAPPIV